MTYTTLISADELLQHLGDPDWQIFDVRHDLFDQEAGIRAYRSGHIPGSQFAGIDTDLSGAKTGTNGRHPLPPRAALIERFRAWGVNNSTQIIAYDAQGGQFAARLWWLARWLGHSAAAVLDGGWPAWLARGGAVETALATPQRGSFTEAASLVPLVGTREVLKSLVERDRLIVDARLAERYRGEQEPIDPVAGHIPGALNRPWTQNLTAEQRFKSPEQLRAEFEALLQTHGAQSIVHQCGSGVTACHNVLAMDVAGLAGSALYGGSWSEWIADPSRPVRTGAEP